MILLPPYQAELTSQLLCTGMQKLENTFVLNFLPFLCQGCLHLELM